MYKATLTKEITVETPNEKGVAAKLSHLLSDQAKVNIRSGWGLGINGIGRFNLITDNNQKAIEALKGTYPKTSETEILIVNTKDQLGEIAEVTDKISQAGININFLHGTYIDGKPVIVISTDDNQKALGLFS